LSFPILTILLLLSIYLINIRKDQLGDTPENKATAERLKAIQYAMFATSVVISVIGFVVYIVEKSREYGDDFRLLTFVFGNAECRKFTPNSAKVIT
jgi:heme/copper-type cytochrome/quinol oxidase subunit 2